jgi:hypothetical protein
LELQSPSVPVEKLSLDRGQGRRQVSGLLLPERSRMSIVSGNIWTSDRVASLLPEGKLVGDQHDRRRAAAGMG